MAAKKPKGSRPKKKGGISTNPNTRSKAIGKTDYEPVAEPTTLHEALQAINMWGFYMSKWGYRIDAEFHKIEKLIGGVTGTPAEHLDPPPEPFK
jgi:hypothetical protein